MHLLPCIAFSTQIAAKIQLQGQSELSWDRSDLWHRPCNKLICGWPDAKEGALLKEPAVGLDEASLTFPGSLVTKITKRILERPPTQQPFIPNLTSKLTLSIQIHTYPD